MSDLGSQRVSRLSLSVGLVGSWRAEVWCDEGAAPTGRQVLTVGDLLAKGVATRGGTDAPDAPHVVHEGAPGWDRPVEKTTTGADGTTITSAQGWMAYANDNGVRLSTVLRDLSKRSGEPLEMPSKDATLGRNWVVVASNDVEPLTLRDALSALVHARYVKPWRVDFDGWTRFGARTGTAANVERTNIMRRDNGVGLAICGTDAFSSIMPGNTLEGHTIMRLVINEKPGNLSAEVWTRAPSPMASIVRRVGETWPQLVYGVPRTYRVGAVASDGRLDLDPMTDAPHLPPLLRVEVWGLGGAKIKPRVGSLALVTFRDANPARPIVTALQPLADSTPTEMNLDADGINLGTASARLVREGDIYTCGVATGPITFVSVGGTDPDPTKVRG